MRTNILNQERRFYNQKMRKKDNEERRRRRKSCSEDQKETTLEDYIKQRNLFSLKVLKENKSRQTYA
jgi:hypothetical protein